MERTRILCSSKSYHKCQERLDSEGLKSALQKNEVYKPTLKDGDKIRKNLPVQHKKDVVPGV